jgi:hypothetical protein
VSERNFVRRRTREGVARRPIAISIVAGATALGLGTTAFDPRGALLIALAAVLSLVPGG